MSLPNDIIREIARHLDDEYDYVHFIKTCRQFHVACVGMRKAPHSWVVFHRYYDDLRALLPDDEYKRPMAGFINVILENRGYTIRFLKENTQKLYNLFPKLYQSQIFYKIANEIKAREQGTPPPIFKGFMLPYYKKGEYAQMQEKYVDIPRSPMRVVPISAAHKVSDKGWQVLAWNRSITPEWIAPHVDLKNAVMLVALLSNDFGRGAVLPF